VKSAQELAMILDDLFAFAAEKFVPNQQSVTVEATVASNTIGGIFGGNTVEVYGYYPAAGPRFVPFVLSYVPGGRVSGPGGITYPASFSGSWAQEQTRIR
jgi:hypothetical protein